jgi:hypothetical protein
MNDKASIIPGRYGDDIISCHCGEVIAISLKTGPLVVTRSGTRIHIPHPDGVTVGCPDCRRDWKYCEKEMRLITNARG